MADNPNVCQGVCEHSPAVLRCDRCGTLLCADCVGIMGGCSCGCEDFHAWVSVSYRPGLILRAADHTEVPVPDLAKLLGGLQ